MKNKRSAKLLQRLKQNNESGFTLIEMLIVLLVISVLLIITIPNVTKNNSTINTKGCEAFVRMVEAQVQAFEMDKNRRPADIDELKNAEYLTQTSCPNGEKVTIGADGSVIPPTEETDSTQ
ncbi:competence type IV pilus major pilin ComGC [Robertmurraya sp. Marseille-Q9965]